MNERFAFKLCGVLAQEGTTQVRNVQMGDFPRACTDAMLGLIDLTSSIIGYCGACNRTVELERQNEQIKKASEEKKRNLQQAAKLFLEEEWELSKKEIEQYRVNIEKESNIILNKMEATQLAAGNNIVANDALDNIYYVLRKNFKETLEFVNKMITKIDDTLDNQKLLAELHEQFRIASVQYIKFVKVCC